MSAFIFAVCQVGAEGTLKNEINKRHHGFRFAFSRPGFVTFRIPDEVAHDRRFELKSVFARTWGFSLGKVSGDDGQRLAHELWQALSERFPLDVLAKFRHLHVWERDRAVPGDDGFEPGPTPLADEVGEILLRYRPDLGSDWKLELNSDAQTDDRVLDCVLVEPGEWWYGWHRARSVETTWPAGVPEIELPEHMISRTYLKMVEALLWSGLPIESGDVCGEIGSSPGGSCQALLERGLTVTGIDPAEMDPAVLSSPFFTHLRARAKDLKRRVFSPFRWLMVDASVAPNYTLDTVEPIVTHRDVRIEGLLLTLKLTDWSLADQVPQFHKRIRSWGYQRVRARQLAFNRREICVAATELVREG